MAETAQPEWKRVMEGDIWVFDAHCVAACFIPCLMLAHSTYRLTGDVTSTVLDCFCMPCCCVMSRARAAKGLGADLSKETAVVNCLLFWVCACFLVGQQWKAVDLWEKAGNTPAPVTPDTPKMI